MRKTATAVRVVTLFCALGIVGRITALEGAVSADVVVGVTGTGRLLAYEYENLGGTAAVWFHPKFGAAMRLGWGTEPPFINGVSIIAAGAARPFALASSNQVLGLTGEFYLGAGGLFGNRYECDPNDVAYTCAPVESAKAAIVETELRVGLRAWVFQLHLIFRTRLVGFQEIQAYAGLGVGLWYDFAR